MQPGLLADVTCSSIGNGSGAASDKTSSSETTTSTSPVGSSGFSLPSGRSPHLADDPDAVLGAQPLGVLGRLALAEDHLDDAGRVAQVDECHATVIAPPRHPAGERDAVPASARRSVPAVWRADH